VSINALTSVPQNIVITTGNTQNYLSWSQVLGCTGYTLQRSATGISGSFVDIGTSLTPSYLDSAVSAGTQYWYQVASNNPSGTSSFNSVGTNNLPLTITPCLPGQINLGYMRYMAKLRADKLQSQFLTDDEWNFNLNQSMKRLYDLLVTKYGDNYFAAPRLQFFTNGTAIYPLPNGLNYNGAPALYKLIGVDVGINATNNQWFTLPRYNIIDRNRYSTLQLAGTVQSIYGLAYITMGANIEFIPLPTDAQAIQILYVPMIQEMLTDVDMMPFSISGWSELVIVDAAIKALVKEESYEQAQALIGDRSDLIERIEDTAANRDVGQSNTVSNTRARCGDQNFGSFGGFGSSGFGNGFGWGG
jgi:hypothetical protein